MLLYMSKFWGFVNRLQISHEYKIIKNSIKKNRTIARIFKKTFKTITKYWFVFNKKLT